MKKKTKPLTILHSNDLHGDFFAEKLDDQLVGGISMLSGYIQDVRQKTDNVLYCISGDMFRGSLIDSEYQGLSTIEIMNLLAPDVVTLGNHEVDYGLAHLLFLEKCAKFPIINCNMYVTTNQMRLFNSHYIKKIDGMKILFIGILTEEVLSATKSENIIGSVVDVRDAAREVLKITNSYKTEDIDFTILLTHIGYEEDLKLAAALDERCGVDIIIGGHSHTKLDEPTVVNGIPIVQAAVGTKQIGRFEINVDVNNNCIDSYTWELVPIDDTHCPRDLDLEDLLEKYRTVTDEKYGRVVTRFKRKYTHPERNRETQLGRIFADALKSDLGVDIVMLGSGSIRKEACGPIVTHQDLLEVFPYDDEVYRVVVTGAQFKKMIAHMLRDEAWSGHTEFYQLSTGLSIVYHKASHTFSEFNFEGKPIDDDTVYSVAIQNFHFSNFDDFFNVPLAEVEQNKPAKVIASSVMQVVLESFSARKLIACPRDARLTLLDD